MIRRPPGSPLFPYPTLFRSRSDRVAALICGGWPPLDGPYADMLRAIRVIAADPPPRYTIRSEEHTSELQSQSNLVCRLLLEKKKKRQHATRPQHNSTQHALL